MVSKKRYAVISGATIAPARTGQFEIRGQPFSVLQLPVATEAAVASAQEMLDPVRKRLAANGIEGSS
jgi:hypothetical protein